MRRLTPEEYRNTVLDLTGVTLTEQDVPAEFSRLRAVLEPRAPVAPGTLEALLLVAEQVSARAITRPQDLLPCAPDQPGSDSCARAVHQPLRPARVPPPAVGEEQMTFLKAFEAGRTARTSTRASAG